MRKTDRPQIPDQQRPVQPPDPETEQVYELEGVEEAGHADVAAQLEVGQVLALVPEDAGSEGRVQAVSGNLVIGFLPTEADGAVRPSGAMRVTQCAVAEVVAPESPEDVTRVWVRVAV